MDGIIEVTLDDDTVVPLSDNMREFLDENGIEGVEEDVPRETSDGDPFGPPFRGPTTEIPEGTGELLPRAGRKPGGKTRSVGKKKDVILAIQEIIYGVLEPADRFKREGEEALAELLKLVEYIGPAWDKLRTYLHDKLDPHFELIKEKLDGELPELAEEAIDEVIERLRVIVTVEAVPIPFPVPPEWLKWLGRLPGLIFLLLLLEVLFWLSRKPQSTTPGPQKQRPLPREQDEGDQEDDERDQGRDDRPRIPQRIIPIPFPTEEGDAGGPEITFKGKCIFVKFHPNVWVRVCRRRDRWEYNLNIATTEFTVELKE